MNSCIFPFLIWVLVIFELIFLFGKDHINTNRPRRSARIEPKAGARQLFSGETYDYTGEYRIVTGSRIIFFNYSDFCW